MITILPHRAILFSLLIMLVFCTWGQSAMAQNIVRTHESFDFGWRFFKGEAAGADATAFRDTTWRRLNLPHDWSIEGPYAENEPATGRGGSLPTGIGWYRKHFTLPASLRGQRVSIEFDGVYMNSDVWINGHLLGHQSYGYIGFRYDLTPYLNLGAPNTIAVRVDNSRQPSSRWYSGSGIYRHTWLSITNPVHVAPWGTYVSTPKATVESATILIRTKVQNESAVGHILDVASQVVDNTGQVVGETHTAATLAGNGETELSHTLEVPKPRLWSIEAPNLYRLRTQVHSEGQLVDEYETPFGIRDIHYDVDRGFLLNGQRVKMHGMCLHHDGGAMGAAVPEGVWERRLKALKQMGCNAVRTSHNPMAPEVYDLCDRLGLLVMDEAFDEWASGKVPSGYHLYFKADWQKDLTAMLHRDRNHPSIVMWSVGNEINEQGDPNGLNILRPLVELCHREDPTRPVTAACDQIAAQPRAVSPEFLVVVKSE